MFTKRQTIFILIGRKESIDLNFVFLVERENQLKREREKKTKKNVSTKKTKRRNVSKESEKNIHSKMESKCLAIDNA